MRAIRHFAADRGLEVLVLQASPFFGAILAGLTIDGFYLSRFALLLVGSVALTAHVFVFNDWAGQSSDLRDPARAARIFGHRGISSHVVAALAIILLVAATAAFAVIGAQAVLFGVAIAALSVLYSCSASFGKGTPVVASVIHVVGGALHFLLGYTIAHPVDARGIGIAICFGLVFAGGHLNQEVRDHDADLHNGIRTNAVVFGPRRTFVASLLVFTTVYITLAALAALAILPWPLLWAVFLCPLHITWSLQALKRGLGFEVARWMQLRYRLLFALVGLTILASA